MRRAVLWSMTAGLLWVSACGAPNKDVAVVAVAPPAEAPSAKASADPAESESPEEPSAKASPKKRAPEEKEMQTPSNASSAQDIDEARALFKQGVVAYQSQDFKEAKRLFEGAYALVPSNAILFNIASAEMRMGQTSLACAHFKDYLAHGDPSSARIQEVQQQVQNRCP
ncbi:MAG: tetratricopeptide repeat protein [Polyangiaceae bacterium]